jgi:hypothetical protein
LINKLFLTLTIALNGFNPIFTLRVADHQYVTPRVEYHWQRFVRHNMYLAYS